MVFNFLTFLSLAITSKRCMKFLKKTAGGHMHIFTLAPLPHRIFSAVVISATAALSLLLFWMKAHVHGAYTAIEKTIQTSVKSGEACTGGHAVFEFFLLRAEDVASS